jgi:hypothetical protein
MESIKSNTGRKKLDKANKKKHVAICLSPDQIIKLKKLGGSRWIQAQIDLTHIADIQEVLS